MTRDVPIANIGGVVVTAWRVADPAELHLTIRGQTEEVRLQCRCGRCHWIVRERHGEGAPTLLATCHNCGTRVELLLEGARLPRA